MSWEFGTRGMGWTVAGGVLAAALACAAAGCSGGGGSMGRVVVADGGAGAGGDAARVTINELQAVNVLTARDDHGAAAAWIELYNPSDSDVALGGYGVTSDLTAPHAAVLAAGVTLPAHGHLVLWCDGNPAAGPTHVNVRLARAGGTIALSRPDGTYIDRVSYGAQEVDFSAAREPDGAAAWVTEWAVSPGAANPAGAGGAPAPVEDAAGAPEAVPPAGDLTEQILGYDAHPQLELRVADDAMATLRATPDEWVPAMLVYGGRSYGPVGVNLKGTSSFLPIDSKPGFRVNVDKFTKAARFFGLAEVLLNNMASDPSMMHERLAYWVARQVGGVPASRSSHGTVTVNGQAYGLYAFVEPPKAPLMARFFTDASGPLFTIHYADFIAADLASFQLQDGLDDTSLISAVTTALAMKPADAAMAAAGQAINVHEFNGYWAVCVLTGHWGGWPYAPAGQHAGANAGTYADPSTKQLHFIPEGINDAFMTADFDFIKQAKSLLTKTCVASAACYEDFTAQLWETLAKLEQLGWAGEHDRVAAQIAPDVAMDGRKPYPDADVAMFQQQMRSFIANRRAAIANVIPLPASH
jgi:spore coat protein H